jgi:hypothetical protein
MEAIIDGASVTLTPRIQGFRTKDNYVHWESGTCSTFVNNLISFLKN